MDGVELETALRTMAYFDPVHFARRITCPVMVTVGFVDNTCFPSGIYAAYNQLAAKRRCSTAWKAAMANTLTMAGTEHRMYAWLTNRMRRDF